MTASIWQMARHDLETYPGSKQDVVRKAIDRGEALEREIMEWRSNPYVARIQELERGVRDALELLALAEIDENTETLVGARIRKIKALLTPQPSEERGYPLLEGQSKPGTAAHHRMCRCLTCMTPQPSAAEDALITRSGEDFSDTPDYERAESGGEDD